MDYPICHIKAEGPAKLDFGGALARIATGWLFLKNAQAFPTKPGTQLFTPDTLAGEELSTFLI
ncbi:MAG: hypothetical protein NTZ71_16470 [Planctomycetota bacterium]|nr:hypothetical protein [Planctomycetota bacterium]